MLIGDVTHWVNDKLKMDVGDRGVSAEYAKLLSQRTPRGVIRWECCNGPKDTRYFARGEDVTARYFSKGGSTQQ